MFILYAIPVGILGGLLSGGRVGALADLRIRWAWLAVAGLVAQVALFDGPLGALSGTWASVIYVAADVAVLAAVLRNIGLGGMPIVALGAAANLAAIVVNGGAMPADPAALATSGITDIAGTNSTVLAEPALRPLTDIFALPAGIPLANVFSLGDVLIGIGVAAVLAVAMRRGRHGPAGVR